MTEEKGRVLYSADFSPISTVCPKCQNKGFIEHNAGLLIEVCDCEAGKEYRARREEILGIPKEEIDDNRTEAVDTSTQALDSGTGPVDNIPGSPDPGKPKQPSKRKARKKAAKKSS